MQLAKVLHVILQRVQFRISFILLLGVVVIYIDHTLHVSDIITHFFDIVFIFDPIHFRQVTLVKCLIWQLVITCIPHHPLLSLLLLHVPLQCKPIFDLGHELADRVSALNRANELFS